MTDMAFLRRCECVARCVLRAPHGRPTVMTVAHIVVACKAVAYVFHGLYSYGLYSYGLYRYGLYTAVLVPRTHDPCGAVRPYVDGEGARGANTK